MNFYNPYFFPYQNIAPRTGLISSLFRRFNFSSILSGTQKTLNTVNQIIPIVKQARPMMDNAKTMFRLMSEFNRNDETQVEKKVTKEDIKKATSNEAVFNINGPTFFQ